MQEQKQREETSLSEPVRMQIRGRARVLNFIGVNLPPELEEKLGKVSAGTGLALDEAASFLLELLDFGGSPALSEQAQSTLPETEDSPGPRTPAAHFKRHPGLEKPAGLRSRHHLSL